MNGEPFEIIDTAGIKRRTKINDDVERFAVLRARDVLGDADVALLVIDGTTGATHQEQRLAEEIAEAGVGLILVLNKWDIRDEDERLHTEDSVADRLAFVDWAPILRISAKTGSRLHRLPRCGFQGAREPAASHPDTGAQPADPGMAGGAPAAGTQGEAAPASSTRCKQRLSRRRSSCLCAAATFRTTTFALSSTDCARRTTSPARRFASSLADGRGGTSDRIAERPLPRGDRPCRHRGPRAASRQAEGAEQALRSRPRRSAVRSGIVHRRRVACQRPRGRLWRRCGRDRTGDRRRPGRSS